MKWNIADMSKMLLKWWNLDISPKKKKKKKKQKQTNKKKKKQKQLKELLMPKWSNNILHSFKWFLGTLETQEGQISKINLRNTVRSAWKKSN